jgi:hypothetical protein
MYDFKEEKSLLDQLPQPYHHLFYHQVYSRYFGCLDCLVNFVDRQGGSGQGGSAIAEPIVGMQL